MEPLCESSEASTTLKQYSLNSTQIAAVNHILACDHTLLVADKGAGKTRVGLAVAAESDGRTLILCPNKVRQGWMKEGMKLNLRVSIVEGTAEERHDILIKGACGIMVMGVDLLPWLVTTYRNPPINGLILDETTRFSKPGSVGVQKLRQWFSRGSHWILGLTAQPVMENPLALYGQALVIDGGQSLGRSYDQYKSEYFYALDYNAYSWGLQPGAEIRLADAVKDLIYVMTDAEYQYSLVPLTEAKITVRVPPRVEELYNQMLEELAIELDGREIEAANAAVLTGKLEQLIQGAVYWPDNEDEDEYDDEESVEWIHTAKFDKLDQLIDPEEPTIVVYQYVYELEELRRRHPHGRDLNDKQALEDFTEGDLNLLFMHFRSGSHGINAQARCCEMICLKPCWSADAWDQVIGRIRRRGQTRPCRRRTLVVPGSIDDVILDRTREKRETGRAVLDHIKTKAGVRLAPDPRNV
jgi:superfamily II DNA or RNA helicase